MERAANPARNTDRTWAWAPNATRQTRPSAGQTRRFGAGRQKGRNRGARALVRVRRPSVERDRRDLEGKPRRHESDGHQEERVRSQALLGER